MTTPIHDFLKKYSNLEFERCHMPGHNGYLNSLDITEINSEAIDIIKESERNAAELFFVSKSSQSAAGRTLFSCSGSTLAISAMLSPCANKRVTAMRGAHRSFIDAAILLGFEIDWVYECDAVSDCITPKTAAVFVTSIDYYGNMCDIKPPATVASKHGVPLLVDNAHGAYLVFTDSHPIQSGAAMSADSAHKTLPALTGAAYLHIAEHCDKHFDKSANDAMTLWGTSSPSYLILDSLDLCNLHIAHEKERAHAAFAAVTDLKRKLAVIGYTLHDSDLLRVTIDVNAYGYSGLDYTKQLRNLGIVCEMYDLQYVILLFSTITQKKNTQRVFEAMRNIPQKQAILSIIPKLSKTKITSGNFTLSPRAAYFSFKRTVSTQEAVGKICAGVHVSIPPCAPLIIPGEIVSREIAYALEQSGIHEIDILSQ